MKRLFFLLLVLFAASCENESDAIIVNEGPSISLSVNPLTYAFPDSNEEKFELSSPVPEFGLYEFDQTKQIFTNYNRHFTITPEGEFSATSQTVEGWSRNAKTLYAYTPYNMTATNVTTLNFTIPTNFTQDTENIEAHILANNLFVTTSYVAAGATAEALTFTPVTALLRFVLSNQTNSELTINGISYSNNKKAFKTQMSYNFREQSCLTDGEASLISVMLKEPITMAVGTELTILVPIVPTTLERDTEVTINVFNSREDIAITEIIETEGLTFDSGKVYKQEIAINEETYIQTLPEDIPGQLSKNWYKDRVYEIALDKNVPLVQLAYKTPQRYFTFESAQFDFVTESDACATVYQACSISKVVFSYCVMRLVDKGIIDLDKPLWEYLGYVEDRFQNVSTAPEENAKNVEYAKMLTARIVLTHRTALPNWAAHGGPNTEKLIFKEQPGLSYNYSGEGIWYLQRVLEHITGMGLEDIARQECFIPLGMTSTSYEWQDEYTELAAYGYSADLVRSGQAQNMKPNAAFSMRTNVKDFSIFIEALMEGKGLSQEIHQEMFRPQCYLNEEGNYYGLGVRINPNIGQECGPVYFHSGSNFNFRCRFWLFPKLKTYFVYFTNSANGATIHSKLVNIFMPGYTGTTF